MTMVMIAGAVGLAIILGLAAAIAILKTREFLE